MMYRVVTTTLEPKDLATCFSVSHDVKPGEGISVIPMLHPDTWTPRWAFADARRARFEIRVTSAAGKRRIAFSEERSANTPASEVEVALSGFAERSVDIEFCAFRRRSEGGAPQRVRAGWAEPRVVTFGLDRNYGERSLPELHGLIDYPFAREHALITDFLAEFAQ
jgi:hypothetical protein